MHPPPTRLRVHPRRPLLPLFRVSPRRDRRRRLGVGSAERLLQGRGLAVGVSPHDVANTSCQQLASLCLPMSTADSLCLLSLCSGGRCVPARANLNTAPASEAAKRKYFDPEHEPHFCCSRNVTSHTNRAPHSQQSCATVAVAVVPPPIVGGVVLGKRRAWA